jgi:hypothetical protein
MWSDIFLFGWAIAPRYKGIMSWNAQSAARTLDVLQQLPELSDRWSPRRPTREAQNQAKMLISRIAAEQLPNASIRATIDGGIDFEWAQADRELSLAISEVGEISYLKSISQTPVDEGPLELAKLNALVDWLLYGR